MKIELKCKGCENLFIADFKHRDKQFCNRKCYFEYAKKNNLLGKEKDDSVWETRTCLECGKQFLERKKRQKKICSSECRLSWNKKDINKKNRITNSKNSLLSKYGVESFFQLKEFKENYKNIFINKYGVDSPMKHQIFVDKLKSSIKEKHLIKLLPKLTQNNLSLLDQYVVNKSGNTSLSYNFKCEVCNNTFTSTILGSGKIPICRKCFPITKNSKLEQIIKDFLNEYKIKHIDNNRKILDGKEIDIYLPEHNIGIEINGNYFHSEISGNKDKMYHLEKMKLSTEKGIKMIQFFEDEILYKKEILISRLSSMLNLNNRIFARKCVVKEVSKKKSTEFLNNNHLQGDTIDKIRYGLYYNDELISLMTFGKKRKSLGNKKILNNEFELIRFCNKINLNVIGGFSKLLNFFIKKNKPNKIETFADIRWSGLNPKETVYFKNGFEFIYQTPPNYWYIKTTSHPNRFHRFSFRKDLLVREGFSKEKTEWEIMMEKGYDRIWDCGSMKFELNLHFS